METNKNLAVGDRVRFDWDTETSGGGTVVLVAQELVHVQWDQHQAVWYVRADRLVVVS